MKSHHWLIVLLLFSFSSFAEVLGSIDPEKDPYNHLPEKTEREKRQRPAQKDDKAFWERAGFEQAMISCMMSSAAAPFMHYNTDRFAYSDSDLLVHKDANKKRELTFHDRRNKSLHYLMKPSENKVETFEVDDESNRKDVTPLQDKKKFYDDVLPMLKEKIKDFDQNISRYMNDDEENSGFHEAEFKKIKDALCACEAINDLKQVVHKAKEELQKIKKAHIIPDKDPSGREPITKEKLTCAQKSLV